MKASVHAVNLGGIVQAAHVLAEPEDGRTGGGGVAADPFENRAAVAGHVRKDVDLGVIPGDKLAVVPDFFGGRQHALIIAEDIFMLPKALALCLSILAAVAPTSEPAGPATR